MRACSFLSVASTHSGGSFLRATYPSGGGIPPSTRHREQKVAIPRSWLPPSILTSMLGCTAGSDAMKSRTPLVSGPRSTRSPRNTTRLVLNLSAPISRSRFSKSETSFARCPCTSPTSTVALLCAPAEDIAAARRSSSRCGRATRAKTTRGPARAGVIE
eukprot:30937-Pelagococcus_subviridis.AAC.10